MFAYCNNNPISRCDPNGYCPNALHGKLSSNVENTIMCTCGGVVTTNESAFRRMIEKVKAFINNTSEAAVLEAEYFAFYKGVLVLKIPSMGSSGLSFGIIFLGSDANTKDIVRHEYGHTRQLKQLGVASYFLYVAIPSFLCFKLTENGVLPWDLYYNLPWEYTADVFGGAQYSQSEIAEYLGELYWALVTLAP